MSPLKTRRIQKAYELLNESVARMEDVLEDHIVDYENMLPQMEGSRRLKRMDKELDSLEDLIQTLKGARIEMQSFLK